jgi:hypothetical protein
VAPRACHRAWEGAAGTLRLQVRYSPALGDGTPGADAVLRVPEPSSLNLTFSSLMAPLAADDCTPF